MAGSITVPIALAIGSAVVGAGAGVNTALQQKAEGKARQAELNRMADDEKTAAIEREQLRRRKLNQALGANIAQTGARGIKFEGSPESVARGAIIQSDLDRMGTQVSDLSRIAQLRRSGKAARIQGKQAALGTLLKTGSKALGQGASIGESL